MTRSAGVETLISEAYEFLLKSDLASAQASFEKALEADFEDEELLYSMKCAQWWADSIAKAGMIQDHFEAGDHVVVFSLPEATSEVVKFFS